MSIVSVKRPKALVWTDDRVAQWQATGVKPSPVMVWTPAQTGAFLDSISGDDLYALFHLIAFRGLRRGEACGLRPEDLDLKAQTLTIATQLVAVGGVGIEENAPKSDAGDRVVASNRDEVAHDAAEAAARLVPRQKRSRAHPGSHEPDNSADADESAS